MDPDERIDVNEAMEHIYFRDYYQRAVSEKACPFKVIIELIQKNVNIKFEKIAVIFFANSVTNIGGTG